MLRSSGQSLDPATRAFMEPRFGRDFSRVHVHTDARAADSARAVNALAYTVGKDLVFGSGQYRPETETGKRLIAHELTHAEQQRNVSETRGSIELGSAGDSHEDEADSVAAHITRPLSISSILRTDNLKAVPAQIMRFVSPGVPIPKPPKPPPPPKPPMPEDCGPKCFIDANNWLECRACCNDCCGAFPDEANCIPACLDDYCGAFPY
ncbi:MAG TPA: DUF4157 domain-containing protein [Blastocatellia bacterium]|nr:DUF4157 domain-containing protein [Blastocatellia bacterium]